MSRHQDEGWVSRPAHLARVEWGVPLRWAQSFPGWEDSVRAFVARARADGLTVISHKVIRETVALMATRPGDPVNWDEWH